MSSSTPFKHTVTEVEPQGASIGDEYYKPSTNELFKRVVYNGNSVRWVKMVFDFDYTERVVSIGTVTSAAKLDLTNGTLQTATLTASTSCTFTMPTVVTGKSFTLLLKQAATTGGGTATFTGVKWGTSGAPTITSTAAKMDILTFVADGTNWYGTIVQGFTP